ncbi:hypothetical protein EWM64_g465 [Hericium alpestre]|uniref:HPP transmembrane region domain-containing protein n=1 Tax=Hericium alpestre TaxID=135208 RepID=A0A4Z0ACS7_9AGAM|nr:hypothetical protein EWM64_g465 [Hericium alpestre]
MKSPIQCYEETHEWVNRPRPNILRHLPYWLSWWLGYRRTIPPRPSQYVVWIWSWIGAFCSLSVIMTVFGQAQYFIDRHVPLLVASYGASAVLIYGAHRSAPRAAPRARRWAPVWPFDTDAWTARIPGTGEEKIGWTAARDVVKALIKLIEVPRGEWPEEVYVSGEQATWHQAMRWVEDLHGQKFKSVTYTSPASVYRDIVDYHDDPENVGKLLLAYMDEWNFSGASATPTDIVEEQRRKFFPDIHFHSVKEIMEIGEREGHI